MRFFTVNLILSVSVQLFWCGCLIRIQTSGGSWADYWSACQTEAHVKCSRTSQLCFGPINYMEVSEIIYSCISMSSGRWCERGVDESISNSVICVYRRGACEGLQFYSAGQVRWTVWCLAPVEVCTHKSIAYSVANRETDAQRAAAKKLPQFLYTVYGCHLFTLSYTIDHGSTLHLSKYTWGCLYP